MSFLYSFTENTQSPEKPDSGLEHHYDVQSQSGVDPLVDQEASNDLTASGGPTRQSGDINGYDSINVDGVDGLYTGDTSAVGGSGQYTVAWVGRYVSHNDTYDYAYTNGRPNDSSYSFSSNNDDYSIVNAANSTVGGSPNGNLHKWIITYDGSTAILEIDGSTVISDSLPAPSPSGSLSIGGDYVDGTFDELDIGEFLFYSEFKNSTERQEIRNYFDRWGF